MKNLISNTAFGKKIESKLILGEIDYKDYFILRCNYDSFLIKPLEKWMFVPCDEDGNVLEEPQRWNDYLEFPESFDGNKERHDFYAYEQAKERCLFEGLVIKGKFINHKESDIIFVKGFANVIIENLVKYNLQLTKTAIKQLGL